MSEQHVYGDLNDQFLLDVSTAKMMLEEYEYSPEHNQEKALFDNLNIAIESHERLRVILCKLIKYGTLSQ